MQLLNPKIHLTAFLEIIQLLTRHRQLTWEMTKREIGERYVGQMLGALWALGHPLILIGVYVFVFTYIFGMKLGGTRKLPLDYTTYLLSGLIPWMAFQESMSKGVTVIVTNANLVKQVVFPIEILPVKGVIASLVTQGVATLVLIGYVLVRQHSLPVTYALLPLLFFLQFLAMTGTSYLLAAVGTYFRDLKEFVQVFSTVGLYIMPVLYLPEWGPKYLKALLYLNPFSYLIWCYQDACYFGRFEHPWAWLVMVILSLGSFYGGYRVFRKFKTMFGNVL